MCKPFEQSSFEYFFIRILTVSSNGATSIFASRMYRKNTRIEHDTSLNMPLEQIIDRNVDPDWAIRIARDNGFELDISVGTMNKYLREHQLGIKQRKNPVRPYRRWEADRPGKLFQFDISASPSMEPRSFNRGN